MKNDLTIFKISIGKVLKFQTYQKEKDGIHEEDFHARLLEVHPDYLVVEQTLVQSEEVVVQKRKLVKGKFTIDTSEVQIVP